MAMSTVARIKSGHGMPGYKAKIQNVPLSHPDETLIAVFTSI